MRPTTPDVLRELRTIGGIVVGSAVTAVDPTLCKDIDVVVQESKNEMGERIRNRKLLAIARKYPEYIDSIVIGHLVVYCQPVQVEIFVEQIGAICKDKRKAANVRAYSTLRRKAQIGIILGVSMRIYRG